MNRADDRNTTHYFRSNRLFAVNDQWYFSTREQLDQGPYATREEAREEMLAYTKIFRKHEQQKRPADAPQNPAPKTLGSTL